jgi:hypothetical protein
MSGNTIIDQMMRETRRVAEVRRKRYIVFFDHLKTLSFGLIGAACINPLVNQVPLSGLSYAIILIGGGVLGGMIIWPEKMR